MKEMEGHIKVSFPFSNILFFLKKFMGIELQQHIKHHKRLHVDFYGSKAVLFSEMTLILIQ